MSFLAARVISNTKWVCVCVCVFKDPARRGMILPRPRVHRSGLDDFLFINSKKTIPLMAAFPPGVWV